MDELIKQVANYIINNRATINETAGAFGKSVSSIKKYINDADQTYFKTNESILNDIKKR